MIKMINKCFERNPAPVEAASDHAKASRVGWRSVTIGQHTWWAGEETRRLVVCFVNENYCEIRDCLPHVVELKPTYS